MNVTNTGDPSSAPIQTITAHNVDLANCDREQVQCPGAIQPHGLLFVLQEPDWTILQLIANVEA